jgi:tRNA U34 5-methylaminomethyl-2-thiouridine-forming methyltransferase MnmC
MVTDEQGSNLEWREDVIPVSRRFDDPYFSLNDGLAETRHVFLAGNQLPARLRAGFQVAELGFGTGLNLLATVMICPPNIPIRFTSFEAYPMQTPDIARALGHFPELGAVSDPFLAAWAAGKRSFQLGSITVEVIIGDARDTLPNWSGRADAWFLDGFSPAKNPELWSHEILQAVADHTAPDGTFATYTAAGHVRRALQDAGFAVNRVKGHGKKRHMTVGVLENA